MLKQVHLLLLVTTLLCFGGVSYAQVIPTGSGSYTKTFPGTDVAGRNGFPAGSPQVSGVAATKPIPTNDWWSKLLLEDHASNLFNYPLTMKTTSQGLVTTYIPWGVIDDQEPVVVGVSGLNASRATISDHSDWTVTMDWSERFQATAGVGMPFVYFQKQAGEVASVIINLGNVTVSGEMILVTDARNGADFAIYGPAGSTWSQAGNTYTSDLNGKDYWSLVMLPQDNTDPPTLAQAYARYAYVFPADTRATYAYDEATASLRTDFTVTTDVKEGTETDMLLGLLPHQWANLAADSPQPAGDSYTTVRGELKTLAGTEFSVEYSFHGILPTLPYLANYSEGFDLSALSEKVRLLENESLATWTDSYNEGQVMNRLIQTARIADKMGETEARDKMIATIQTRLEDWLTAEAGEVAFLFYYNTDWTALLGYPSGHGQDTNLNDHHFHWGYFIHAAAFMEQYSPGWAAEWGDMVDLLVRDAAGGRDDAMFPYLRNFSPYAGHSWANGFASFPQGNDQESTSESMQFCSSLIHWGAITGNEAIRDLGIYLYTTEQSAIEEYWFDMYDRNFRENQAYALVSRVWGNSYDNGTFWTNDIEASYGIELYPIHGGSMYLGHNTAYAEKLWAEIAQNTGILNQDDNVNLWHDTMWKFLAFTDPQKAIDLYNAYPDRNLKFGISDAQTYYWLHAMNALGQVDTDVTADYPLAVVFTKDGERTYTAHNYSDTQLTVTFSDGVMLDVPAHTLATSRDVDIAGTLSTSFETAYPGGSVELTVDILSGTPSRVAFYKNGVLLAEDDTAPYAIKAANLQVGKQGFYAKIYQGDAFNTTNIIEVTVGSQQAYQGMPATIPGTIEAGHYDEFPGASGQGISYYDGSAGNNGDFRPEEDVDAASVTNEGATIGWIGAGEWVEYTADISTSGYYDLSFRYASGNQAGGGPFHLEMDGERVSEDINLAYTGDWNSWQTATVTGIALHEGEHIIRLVFDQGEFNLGKMTFAYGSVLPYAPPIADAGDNVTVVLPATTATLDGSRSRDADSDLTYLWEQVNGPSTPLISDAQVASPQLSDLIEGIYTFRLTVSDGTYSSADEVLVIVSATGNFAPTVAITSPSEGAVFEQGTAIDITVNASDIDGDLSRVEFFDNDVLIGQDDTAPFAYTYINASVGAHALTAKATDDDGAVGLSEAVNVSIAEVQECTQTLSEAREGSFSTGYTATFRTVGNAVTITFTLLDTDKSGVVAYLFRESPFMETPMEQVSGNTFRATVNGLSQGATISYAAKFAFAGGLAVTKYIRYEVGTSCGSSQDTQAPVNVTATASEITNNSLNLRLNGSDNSGTVVYDVSYLNITTRYTASSGVEKVVSVEGLSPETAYTFTIKASDPTGNVAADVVVNATTLADSVVLGLDDELMGGVSVYPNPSAAYLSIDIPSGSPLVFHSIVNAIGARQQVAVKRSADGYWLDMHHLSPGIYFINLATGEGKVVRGIRIMKE